MKKSTLKKLKSYFIQQEKGMTKACLEQEKDKQEKENIKKQFEGFKEDINEAENLNDIIDFLISMGHDEEDLYKEIIEYLDTLIK